MAGRSAASAGLERGRQERNEVGMSGLYQGSLDRHEAVKFEEKDGGGKNQIVGDGVKTQPLMGDKEDCDLRK